MLAQKKIVIVGSNGRLGKALNEQFQGSHEVLNLGRSDLNLMEHGSISEILDSLEFDLLFLTAAQTNVDRCEEYVQEAHDINATAPGVIAKICSKKGAKMVHFSTDFVFDGEKEGLYSEGDSVNPISVYGRSKYEGEQNVLTESSDHLVARLSWVFGAGRPGFPEWIIAQAKQNNGVCLPEDKIGCPAYSYDVAHWIDRLLFHPLSEQSGGASGLIHLCNSEACTWREWGQGCIDLVAEKGEALLSERIGLTKMSQIAAFVAKRPHNSALATDRFTHLTGVSPRIWKSALREHLCA